MDRRESKTYVSRRFRRQNAAVKVWMLKALRVDIF